MLSNAILVFAPNYNGLLETALGDPFADDVTVNVNSLETPCEDDLSLNQKAEAEALVIAAEGLSMLKSRAIALLPAMSRNHPALPADADCRTKRGI